MEDKVVNLLPQLAQGQHYPLVLALPNWEELPSAVKNPLFAIRTSPDFAIIFQSREITSEEFRDMMVFLAENYPKK